MGIIRARLPQPLKQPQFSNKLMYAIRDFIVSHGCSFYDDEISTGIISNYFRLKNGICVEQKIAVRQEDAVCITTLSCPIPTKDQRLLAWALAVANDINQQIDDGCFLIDLETGDIRFRSFFSPGNAIYTEDIDMFLGYPKQMIQKHGAYFLPHFYPKFDNASESSYNKDTSPHFKEVHHEE